MTTATKEATDTRDAIRVRIDKRATLNYKGAKAQKVYLHLHGGETIKIQSRGRTVAQFAQDLRAVADVEVPKHLKEIAATKLMSLADQKLVPDQDFSWSVAVPEEKDNAAKAAADAKKHAAADGPPILIFGDDVIDLGEPLVILEFDPTGE